MSILFGCDIHINVSADPVHLFVCGLGLVRETKPRLRGPGLFHYLSFYVLLDDTVDARQFVREVVRLGLGTAGVGLER